MASTIEVLSASQTAANELVGMLKRRWEAYWTGRAQRTTVMMLRALDDRALHDIGLDRSEIESVVYDESCDRQPRYVRHCR
jgi:uncharacterized protein YjiS (DUF1127 family)